MIRKTSREEFISSLTDLKEDKFAKTFVAKCDMIEGWDNCMTYWDQGEVAAAILVTLSKRSPKVANLQLLHTFYKHRGKGLAKKLVNWGVEYSFDNQAEYFRVSSELDSVGFYEKCGFKFVCRQKTAKLSMFKMTSPIIENNTFEPDDYIWKTMNKKGKGGCIECYVSFKGIENFL